MNKDSVKKLIDNNDLVTLEIMLEKHENKDHLDREVDGKDDDEKSEHLKAAIAIKQAMFKNGTKAGEELDKYLEKK